MALDRQTIEKRDFPIARRGYDPEQVDAHLARVASEMEALQAEGGAAGQPRATSMAIAASDQVRSIIEAAENSAAEIEQQAREEAAAIRADAKRDAETSRDEALAKSADHVATVQNAAAKMLERVEAMQQEMGTLVQGLRDGAASLNSDLGELHGNVDQLYDGVRSAEAPVAAAPEQDPEPIFEADDEDVEEIDALPPVAEATQPEPQPVAPAEAGGGEDRGADVEGARLIALNMALNGSSREDTDAYLVANFDLADRRALLDEVYATVEG